MHSRLRRLTLQRGFTLIEILTVLAIIGILTAILVPAVSNALQRSRLTAAVAEIRTINTVVAEAVNRLNGYLPITEGHRTLTWYLMFGNLQVETDAALDVTTSLTAAQNTELLATYQARGITYSKLITLDHLLTGLNPPLLDGPWRTRFGGAGSRARLVQPPITFNEQYRRFSSAAPVRTVYNLTGANSSDDASPYSRIETTVIVANTVFNISNPALADVNTVGGINFDIDGDGLADEQNRMCAYIIYKKVPATEAYALAREFNPTNLMTDNAPGGIAPQTKGKIMYGLPVGGLVDAYVHLMTF